jgi:hypothetical protein
MGVSCSSFARGRRGSSAPSGATRPQAAPHGRNACRHARRCDHPELARSLHAPWRNGGSQQAHIRCSHWVRSGVHDQPIGAWPWHGRCAVSDGTAAVQSKADETGPQIRDPGAFRLELELRGRRGLRTRRMSRPPRPQTPSSDALALDQHARPGADRQRVGVHVQHDPWANCWSIACLA